MMRPGNGERLEIQVGACFAAARGSSILSLSSAAAFVTTSCPLIVAASLVFVLFVWSGELHPFLSGYPTIRQSVHPEIRNFLKKMKSVEKLKIFKKLFAFSKWLMNHTMKFPKSHRFSIAVKLENTVLELIEVIAAANMRKDKSELLGQADEKLLYLKILCRLSYEMKFIAVRSYEYASKELSETGRMLGKWIQQQQTKQDEKRGGIESDRASRRLVDLQ